MQQIIDEIAKIHELYRNAKYKQAFKLLANLCESYSQCSEFSQHADSICTRFHSYQDMWLNGLFPEPSQRISHQNEILYAYRIVYQDMIDKFIPQESVQQNKSNQIAACRDKLESELNIIEIEITQCGNPQKSNLLWKIQEQLKEAIKCFCNLIESFRMVEEHE